jgi:dipeptidyl aminopeptidase/acylaminoacyl peptidase
MGTSGDVAALEGKTGGNASESSRVQGIIDFYGPSDFVKRSETHPSKTDEPKGGVYQLLGGPVKENLEAARVASPVSYVSVDDPPLLILHGTKDRTVFFDQSEIMRDVYLEKKLEVTLHVVPGAGHGWKPQKGDKEQILQFLKRIYSLANQKAKDGTLQ